MLGLASRSYPIASLDELFGKYPGDALWAAMVFFGLGAFRPRASTRSNALLALAICCVVEAMKLYQAPWIVGIRETTLGHLVFGHTFSVENLVAYAVGVVVALGIEALWPYGGDEKSSNPTTPAIALAICFGLLVLGSAVVASLLPPPRDLVEDCRKQCAPRFSRVLADKSYPMSAKGTYRQTCECY